MSNLLLRGKWRFYRNDGRGGSNQAALAFLALTAVVFFAALTPTSHAQLRQIQLRVDGLACPFCAYGLEKNVKALKGVKKLKHMPAGL
ncbi:MAG: hypothetical protein O7E52_08645 [Candidatus Poribacteria bacterium]|nr:hypothetical protein [Candidatus Poribacteria bacterium]